ncbi:hypothetical protein FHP29_17705 [Nocardioides albidus]|uniref:Uncharacterized protein n=1 Tax=Nocardioides albidus TaxID=1517589 RepID=A0A5C4VP84_9ACTN|nr:hypothetical protein [Nocardioides albidus]TNM37628.1 hypothetical protein FHP29_17705 [Nocardioides albidus]
MENITMQPVFPAMTSAWQLPLSASFGHATSAPATLEVQGFATRPAMGTTVFGTCALVAIDAAERKFAIAGAVATKGRLGSNAAYVPGPLAWSPPI